MGEISAIPVVVLSRQQDPVEIINSTLRNAGQAVHCTWVPELNDLADALGAHDAPQLLFFCVSDADEISSAMEQRARLAPQVPVLMVRESLTEADLVRGLELGAADVVTLTARGRLQTVAARALDAARLDHALSGTLASARQYRDQMRAFMTGSTDAIAHVQEGIVVDVNPAWSELFGHADPGDLLGQPLMDMFDARSHAALKGALVAAAQGRWSGHALSVMALQPAGDSQPLELSFERFEFEGEPAVRLRVATQKRDLESLANQLEQAMRLDSRTGLLRREAFIESARERALQPLKAGLRAVAYLSPDSFGNVELEYGPIVAEEVLDALSRRVQEQLQPGDLASRVAPHGIALLVERGNPRDQEAWLAKLRERIAAEPLLADKAAVELTCSIGSASLHSHGGPLQKALETAIAAQRAAADAGGDRCLQREPAGAKPAIDEADRAWANQIKAALMANRFRLVQQPIANLVGEERPMFDLLVRMLDESGQEVLPTEFLAAAERTDLMKNIDRWIVGAAMSFCAAKQPYRVFVRLSRDSMHDQTLGTWLQQQLKASGIEPSRIVFEITEEMAREKPREARSLQGLLSALGIEFAVEHFGAAGDAAALLHRLPVNYVKIDGALMQGLANDRPLQERVKALVDVAREHCVTTIAERVEDANTMAVLWQLGIEFIQGYFVNSPERVVM
ncbi:MAG: EAL domain-containing protein [Steroidobacteraceae bacterium]|nr:EAL domain-containing protein [Steroidobacteraceae bacterium]MBP7014510.1 EAL domain-containing protein [Steroidobacteraceae bacterium]